MATQYCLSAWNNSRTFAGASTVPRTRLSNSFPVCLFGSKSGDKEGQGESSGRCCWRGTVWCCVLNSIWHCPIEGLCHTTFDARNSKQYAGFFFLTQIILSRKKLCKPPNLASSSQTWCWKQSKGLKVEVVIVKVYRLGRTTVPSGVSLMNINQIFPVSCGNISD